MTPLPFNTHILFNSHHANHGAAWTALWRIVVLVLLAYIVIEGWPT
jgi:hypothetical protein